MARRGSDAVAVHVEPDGQIAGRFGAQGTIEQQALQRKNRQAHARSFELHPMAEAGKRAGKHIHPHIGAAAAANVERSGSKEANTHRATIIV